MLLVDLAQASRELAASPARSRKIALLADCLRLAEPSEVPTVTAYLSGQLRQRRTGLGFAALRDLPPPAAESNLTVPEVHEAFEAISGLAGAGSQQERRRQVAALFGRATADEQWFLRGLVAGELRQGALEALMIEGLARAAELPLADVRRAVMLRGAVGPVAEAALAGGPEALAQFRLQVGRPLQPMLAQTETSVAAALAKLGCAGVEWKLDGIRIQVHRAGELVRVFTRTLDEITDRVPEVVDAVRDLPADEIVLDGEVLALRPDGRPRPFQATASRTGSKVDVSRAVRTTPLTPFFFDVLHADGEDLLGLPASTRIDRLSELLPEPLRVPRLVTDDSDAAAAFLDDALGRGHEGVVIKSLDAPYEAGRRGAGWIKVKPRHTLDLVVLAAEWGHGRRRGWLSNLHLGARDPETGSFVMLGKTFKGLTDAMLTWQTEQLLALEVSRTDWAVQVRPELVVEVAFDGVQTSSRYPGGMALRFARVLRHRTDKRGCETDTIETVRAIHRAGLGDAGQHSDRPP